MVCDEVVVVMLGFYVSSKAKIIWRREGCGIKRFYDNLLV